MPRLLTLDEAAAELGVSKLGLRREAERHGFLVRMGRALRIDPATLPELVERCRDAPRAHACTSTARGGFTTSATMDDSSEQALAIAEKLKRCSRGTLRASIGRAAKIHRNK